jgi:hypothetical protein
VCVAWGSTPAVIDVASGWARLGASDAAADAIAGDSSEEIFEPCGIPRRYAPWMINTEGGAVGVQAARRLAGLRHVDLQPGLTDGELARVERQFGFEFADDHRAFLAAALPVGPSWPDWRNGDPAALRDRLNWPVHGVLFDVEHWYWHESWGQRPDNRGEALATAKRHLAAVPQMVPVFGHRYLPAGRGTSGHPVLSMYQTDIIFYGLDLADYMRQEFGGPEPDPDTARRTPEATVEFWRSLVS